MIEIKISPLLLIEQEWRHRFVRESSRLINWISDLEIPICMVPPVLKQDRAFLLRDLGPRGKVKNALLQAGSSQERKQYNWERPIVLPSFHFSHTSAHSVAKSCLTLATPWTVACQVPLSMCFPMQEYWSGSSFPSLGDLPNPGIKPMSPELQADSLLLSHLGKSSLTWGMCKRTERCHNCVWGTISLCHPGME